MKTAKTTLTAPVVSAEEKLWNQLSGIDHIGALNMLRGCKATTKGTRLIAPKTEVVIRDWKQVRGYKGGWEMRIKVAAKGQNPVELTSWGSLVNIEYPSIENIHDAINSRHEYLKNLD